MKKIYLPVFLCFLVVFTSLHVAAQSTFSQVQSFLQTDCAASGCHGSGNAVVFDVDASSSDLYDALVNVSPVNTAAGAKGNLLIDPGHPYNSFLLRKIGSDGFDPYITIDSTEKAGHPTASLQKYEIELIRQWILEGAQETGNVVDYQLVQDYYLNGGLDFISVPTPPAPGKGFQVRYGPIFYAPNAEEELMKKQYLRNTEVLKISALNGSMSWESHHMLLFKLDENEASSEREGMRSVPLEAYPFNKGTLTSAWQDDGYFELPEGTAFYWQPGTVLDFDYHVRNYSQTEILPADFYLNIYFDESATPPIEMFAELENETALALSQGTNFESKEHTFNEDRYIWMLSSHTHKYGTDYDIFMRNQNGTKGEQIYEGFYNQDYSFNQGFYDWEHPAIRLFEPLKKVSNGLLFETSWDVTGSCTSLLQPLFCVTFGLTTDDEMMLFTYLYTKQEPPSMVNGISEIDQTHFSVYPNPINESTVISYNLDKTALVKVEIVDVPGRTLQKLLDKMESPGRYSSEINFSGTNISPGVYFITLFLDGKRMATQRIVKL